MAAGANPPPLPIALIRNGVNLRLSENLQKIMGNLKSQCLGKEKFATPNLANEVLRRSKKKKPTLNAYKCIHCGFFHLGGGIRKRK